MFTTNWIFFLSPNQQCYSTEESHHSSEITLSNKTGITITINPYTCNFNDCFPYEHVVVSCPYDSFLQLPQKQTHGVTVADLYH